MGSAYEPALKKARTFEVPPIAVNGIEMENDCNAVDQSLALQVNGDLECRRYSTSEGCPYGGKCRFKHGPTG